MIAEQMSDFIFQCKFEDLPKDVVDKAKLCILDWIGCGIAGANDTIAQKFVKIAIHNSGCEESTIIGSKIKVSALWGAFANGAISHAVEMDDGHKWSISHPGVSVIPTALAIGETISCTGKDLITAIVIGYDISMRVGEAVGSEHYKIWHTTSTCGTFGAAATSAKLLGLSVDEIADSLGNAGSQAAGLWQFIEEGAMTKLMHTAKIGFNGLLSSQLAQIGLTGAHKIFEGEKGFLKAYSTSPNFDILTENLGKNYKIKESNFKVHASCGHTHSSIDATLKAIAGHQIDINQIREINVYTYETALRLTGNYNPMSKFEAKFSTPYCISAALLFGQVDEKHFNSEILFNEKLRDLISKIKMHFNPDLEKLFPECRPVIIDFVTDLDTISVANYNRKGDPENPLSKMEVEEKFCKLVENVIDDEKTRIIIDLVENIESIGDIKLLTDAF
jgi:2-methylcitrate dehydratase PrpD